MTIGGSETVAGPFEFGVVKDDKLARAINRIREVQGALAISSADLARVTGILVIRISDATGPRDLDLEGLQFATGLKELEIHGDGLYGTRVKTLAPLARLGGLERLALSRMSVGGLFQKPEPPPDLGPLNGLESLRSLSLRGFPNFGDIDLKSLPKLEELVLEHVEDVDLSKLGDPARLAKLVMRSCGVKGRAVPMANLTSMELEQMYLREGSGILDALPSLTSLKMKRITGVRTLKSVTRTPQLKALTINHVYYDSDDQYEEPIDVAPLAELRQLESLHVVGGSEGLAGFEALKGNARLRELRIDSVFLSKLEGVFELTQLTKLAIDPICGKGEHLAGLQSLTELELRSYCSLDIEPLTKLHRLQHLRLVGDDLDGGLVLLRHLSSLARLPYLTDVEIDGFKIYDLARDLDNLPERINVKLGRCVEERYGY